MQTAHLVMTLKRNASLRGCPSRAGSVVFMPPLLNACISRRRGDRKGFSGRRCPQICRQAVDDLPAVEPLPCVRVEPVVPRSASGSVTLAWWTDGTGAGCHCADVVFECDVVRGGAVESEDAHCYGGAHRLALLRYHVTGARIIRAMISA